MNNITFSRHTHIAENILVVDGLNGAGKSILGPVLGSFLRVEKVRMEHIYEYLCVLRESGKIEEDAAVSLMNIYADLAIYNQMISREVNLRPADDSGILNNAGALTYLKRLFEPDGDEVMQKIRRDRPILQLMTHQVMPVMDLIFSAYGERVKVLEMERHPVYLIDHWLNYMERFGTDPREFNLWLGFEQAGRTAHLPWFAEGWEEDFLSLEPIDRVVRSLDHVLKLGRGKYESLSAKQKAQVVFISFEKFVTDPQPCISELEAFLDTRRTPATLKALKKQKCPRKQFTAGKGYKRYGWQSPPAGLADREDYDLRYEKICLSASTNSIELLDDMILKYEERFDIWSDR